MLTGNGIGREEHQAWFKRSMDDSGFPPDNPQTE